MDLDAKEMRMVILGLKKLVEENKEKMDHLADNDDGYVFLSNDAMLIDTMINGFEEEYKQKFSK